VAPSERYGFGDFILERTQQRVLRRDGTDLGLTPRLFSALLLFVERAGDLLDKDTLILAIWPGLVVEENNLSQVISALRRALGDDVHGSRYIQTVPRRGFRFVAPVTLLPDAKSEPMSEAADPPQPVDGGAAIAIPVNEPSITPVGLSRRRLTRLAALGAAGAAIAGAAWWTVDRRSGRRAARSRSTLAVLPFKPLVLDGRDELLEVGMADSLIARLSTLRGIVVRSVGSVRRYAGPDQDPMRAARELDVAWIVDGSLQRRGEQLRVTARLLSVPDGVAAWSGSFDERVTSVFDVQDAISDKVARVLASSLDAATGSSGSALAMNVVGGTRNADAYQLYLAARQHAQGIRAAGLAKSAALYNQAIEIDPGYALAYAGLVETYRRMLFGADLAPAEAFEPARVAAMRALELAPGLAEAHAGLGWIRFWYDYDWAGAEDVFRKALALNPNVVEANFGLGLLLLSLDRPDEGLKHLRSSRELDPMSLILNTLEAAYLFDRGRRDEASLRLDRAFQIDPDFWVAHLTLGIRQAAEHRPEQSLASFRRADTLADGSTQATAALGIQLAQMNQLAEARSVRDRLLALQKARYVPPTSVAALHASLGETMLALDSLERAFAVRDTRLVYLKDDARWANLRKEPRFVSLLSRMKLDRFGPGASAP
jgi:DNA-binding winged helix-turn-helix (wHTH) protein/TolB-like protein/tetratricopeptide (TPR) repeat protein